MKNRSPLSYPEILGVYESERALFGVQTWDQVRPEFARFFEAKRRQIIGILLCPEPRNREILSPFGGIASGPNPLFSEPLSRS